VKERFIVTKDGEQLPDLRPHLEEWLEEQNGATLVRLEYQEDGEAAVAYLRAAGITVKRPFPMDVAMTAHEFTLYTGGILKKIYFGDREKSGRTVFIREIHKSGTEDVVELDPTLSLAIMRHSPDGFEWGYAGSGPSQLALAILMDALGDQEQALALYHQFKFAFVANFKTEKWELPEEDIRQWIKNQQEGALL
jgi:hypothetical protein